MIYYLVKVVNPRYLRKRASLSRFSLSFQAQIVVPRNYIMVTVSISTWVLTPTSHPPLLKLQFFSSGMFQSGLINYEGGKFCKNKMIVLKRIKDRESLQPLNNGGETTREGGGECCGLHVTLFSDYLLDQPDPRGPS